MKKTVFILVLLLSVSSLFADEGMWLLTQIPQLELQKKGLRLTNEEIYHPDNPCIAKAVILLGGGTSSFVSPDGLILTNHHVAFDAAQRASTQGVDYLTNGFLAGTRQDEMEAPGYQAQVILEMKDVTDDVLAVAADIEDPVEREKAIEKKIKMITDMEEEKFEDLNARVAEMYNGKQYVLFVYQRFEDVRIVYMPPLGIGSYGGEIDNWMWPRHTGDFAFMRVYMSPDGRGAKYSEDNVPYKPTSWLKIADNPIKKGDFTFSLGYPGFTTRYRTSNSVKWNLTKNYPRYIQIFEDVINLLEEVTADSPDGQIKVASILESLNNTKKNYIGKVEGMNKTNFLDKKIKFEEELTAFLDENKDLKSQYGNTLSDIKAEYDILEENIIRDNFVQRIQILSGTLFGIADQVYGIAREREKPEEERQPNFSERNIERTVNSLQYQYMSYYEPADKALLVKALQDALEEDPDQKMTVLDDIIRNEETTIAEFVEQAYQKSKLADLEYAKSLFSKSSSELEALDDPFINMSKDIYELAEASAKQMEKFGAKIGELRKQYMDALYAWKGGTLYPEANRTIRLSYGAIAGYKPRDAVWYEPFTTLNGAIEKHTGESPFNLPEGLRALAKNKDYGKWIDPWLNDVPLDFLNKLDDTGGSSGSPVMNGNGEIIGIAFDGNYEAMTSDWQYDADLQRGISVDIRYVLFITQKLAGADFILEELGVAK